jgi:iron complex outermembrane recepter protein
MKMLKLCGASLIALSFALPALAQTTPPTPPSVPEADEIVIVTATKRETTLQSTPIAVSVVTADKLTQAGVRDLTSLTGLVPSLRVSQLVQSTSTNFIIRGFGNGAFNPGIEPSVGVFIDGVYRSRSASALGDLPDLKRIEVLRGPQSTLFGKNASVGVISLVTQEPKFEFGGNAELSYGNYNAVVAKANVTGPINEQLAFSLGAGVNKRDGFGEILNLGITNNTRDRWWTRGQLLFQPSETMKFRLIADYDTIDENCCIVSNLVDGPTGGIVRALGGQINSNNRYSLDGYMNYEPYNELDNYGVSLQGDFDVGNLAITSITAARKLKSVSDIDADLTSLDFIGKNFADRDTETFTQEVRITSKFDGPVNFLVGGFYMAEKIDQVNELLFGRSARAYIDQLIRGASGNALNDNLLETLSGNPVGTTFHQTGQGMTERFTLDNDSFSLFGTLDFEASKKLKFTAGVAYTDDRKEATGNIVSTDRFSSLDLVALGAAVGVPLANRGIPCTAATRPNCNSLLGLSAVQFLPPFLNFPNAVESGKTHDSKWSYSARVAYEVSQSINVYASYATGFKASSWNLSRDSRPFARDFIPGSTAAGTPPATSPIRTAGLAVTNLSTGTRFAGPENAEVVEVGLKAKWPGIAFNLTLFDQSIKGFQDNVFTGTGFVLSNAGEQKTTGIEFDGFVRPTRELTVSLAFTVLNATYPSFVGCQVAGAPSNCSGFSVPNVAELSGTLGINYNKPLSNGAAFYANTNYSFDSPTLLSLNVAGGFERDVSNLDATIGYKFANGVDLSLWGRNLTDAKFNSSIFPATAQGGSVLGYPNVPPTWGAALRYKF